MSLVSFRRILSPKTVCNNSSFQVRPKSSSHEECVKQIQHMLQKEFQGQSGIIYTMTIKDAEQLASDLRSQGLRVAPYHAQLDADVRSKVHTKWVKNDYQVIMSYLQLNLVSGIHSCFYQISSSFPSIFVFFPKLYNIFGGIYCYQNGFPQ